MIYDNCVHTMQLQSDQFVLLHTPAHRHTNIQMFAEPKHQERQSRSLKSVVLRTPACHHRWGLRLPFVARVCVRAFAGFIFVYFANSSLTFGFVYTHYSASLKLFNCSLN